MSELDEKAQEAEKAEPTEKPEVSDKNKKKKAKYVDDGHTVYSMEAFGRRHDKDDVGLTKKEKHAAIKAAFRHYLPVFLGVVGCFTAAALLIYLWLS